MDKIQEALKKVLPEDQVKDVASAVQDMLDESKQELETEYQKNLDEAYTQLSKELAEAERVAEEGYREAWAIIQDQQNRQEAMREEFEGMLEEQYEEAYKMILEERGKNNDIESTMYEEYEKKLNDMKTYIVEKVDQFLQLKGKEIYEQAYRDATNDPIMAEHKVVLDKIVDLTSDYLSEEDVQFATGKKLEDAQGEVEKLKSQVKMMEGRNIRLSTENTKMQQQLNEAASVLRDARLLTEQKARAEKAANVQGRGRVVSDDEQIISENREPEVPAKTDDKLNENFDMDLALAQKLAGITK